MRQKVHKMVSMFLAILILATMIIPSHAISIFPEGFIVGSVGDDNWAYKDTENYSAILSLRDDGDYLFTYAFRDADKSGSMTLSFDEIQNIDTILQELEEEARLLVIQSPQEMNLEGEPVVAEPLASNDSLFVNAIIDLLRDEYDDEYDDYEAATRPGNGVMYRVRESLIFDGESTSLVKAIDSAFTAAQAASEIAAKFGVATPKALQFVLKTGKAVSSYAVLTEDMRVQRYRGVACYTRYGTAQSTGATEQYYESATKNILEYFLVDTVIHGGSSDAADYVEWSGAPSETIYIPSEYCFSETYLLDCAEDMH